jgi:hypothetical protein
MNQQEEASSLPLLLGRGQGVIVSALLGNALKIQNCSVICAMRLDVSLTATCSIPDIVKIQLRYDTTRRNIISHLHRDSACYSLSDIVSPFVTAAAIVSPEPYYLDALPNACGQCTGCGQHFPR